MDMPNSIGKRRGVAALKTESHSSGMYLLLMLYVIQLTKPSEPVHRAGETWNDESDEDDLGDWNEYETNVYDDDGDSVRSSKASEWNGEFMDTAFLDARSDSSEYIEEEMRGQEEEEDDELDKQNAESWVTED